MDNKIFLDAFLLGAQLKHERRTGWNVEGPNGTRRVPGAETVASHSWGMSYMALVLRQMAPEIEADWAKIGEMCLIHDLIEAKEGVGDIADQYLCAPEERAAKKAEKQARELAAIEEIRWDLGPAVGEHIYRLWMEYEEGTTREAQITKQLDKLDVVLQAMYYSVKPGCEIKLKEWYDEARPKIEIPQLVTFLEELVLPLAR